MRITILRQPGALGEGGRERRARIVSTVRGPGYIIAGNGGNPSTLARI